MLLKNTTVLLEDSRYAEEFEIDAINKSEKTELLTKFVKQMIDIVVDRINRQTPQYLSVDNNEFPVSNKSSIDLTTLIVNEHELCEDIFGHNGDTLGAWIFENHLSEEGLANNKFEVSLIVDYDKLVEGCVQIRKEEVFAERSDYDEDYFRGWCITFAHEVGHILDANMNMGGIFSPNEIECFAEDYGMYAERLYRGSETNPEVMEALEEAYEAGDSEDAILHELMEKRVESFGRRINDWSWSQVRKIPEFDEVMENLTSDINAEINSKSQLRI